MKNIFCIFLVIFSQLSWSSSGPQTVVSLASRGDTKSFQAYLKANPRAISLAQSLVRTSPTKDQSEQLYSLFQTAQKLFFNADREKARIAYQKVVELLNTADWQNSHRKMISTAALRLAELSDSDLEQENALMSALSADVKLTPDTSIFSPPIVKKLSQLRETKIIHKLSLPPHLKNADILRVAGQSISPSKTDTLSFPNFAVRVFAYSSKWGRTTEILTPETFQSWSPKTKNIFTGDCQKGVSPSKEYPEVSQVFMGKDCLYSLSLKQNLFAPMSPPKRLDLVTRSDLKNSSGSVNFNAASAPTSQDAWWKNKWLWIGIAGAGAAWLVYENNQNKNSSGGSSSTVYE